MSIILVIVIILIAALAIICAYAATRPDTFRVQRMITIAARPEDIYPVVVDLHGWAAWSPYEKKDPAMKRSFSGTESGLGAIYEWDGNNAVGNGRMEIIEASPPSKIVIKLDFFKPFKAHNTAEFTFVPQGGSTIVAWAMFGPAVFMTKLMGLFMNMDKMIGTDFEVGLQNLKARVEQA